MNNPKLQQRSIGMILAVIFLAGCAAPALTLPPAFSPPPPPTTGGLVSDFMPCTGAPSGKTTTPSAGRALMAYSTNGIDFQRPANPRDGLLIDRIGVPDAVVLPSGRVLLYFVTGCRIYNGAPSASNDIAVAVSDRQGAPGTWVFKDVHFAGVPSEYGSGIVDPNVVLLPDGRLSLFASMFWQGGSGAFAFVSTDGGFTFVFQGLKYAGIIDPENYRFTDTNWQIITGEPGKVKGYAMSTDGGNTFQPFGSFPGHLVVHEIAVTDRAGEYRAYVSAQDGILSFLSTSAPWTTWTQEPNYRLQVDAASGLESCHVRFPTVIRLGPGNFLMIYETVIPGCGCSDDPVCS